MFLLEGLSMKAVPTVALLTSDWADFGFRDLKYFNQPMGAARDDLLPLI